MSPSAGGQSAASAATLGRHTPLDRRTREGLACALAAYLMWGVFPVYFKLVDHVAPLEVLAHRIVWAVPFGIPLILLRRQGPEVMDALRDRRKLGLLSLSATLIALNWLVYIWAVQHEQIFQASLGYYINPLMMVLVGVVFFRERLRRLQSAAVVLATVGVLVLAVSGGVFPAVALTLATSFTIYGVIRSRVAVGGMPGLFIETLILLPVAALYLAWLVPSGGATFGDELGMSLLLTLSGPLTVLPLLCFALAARRLRLSTIGVMQFIAPTMQFVIAVGYGEALTPAHIVCFALIWTAVALFSGDAWRASRGGEDRKGGVKPR